MSIQLINPLDAVHIASIGLESDQLQQIRDRLSSIEIVESFVIFQDAASCVDFSDFDVVLVGEGVDFVNVTSTQPTSSFDKGSPNWLIVAIKQQANSECVSAPLEYAVSDVIEFPVSSSTLTQRFELLVELAVLRKQLARQRSSIEATNTHVTRDQQLAKEVFDKVAYNAVTLPNINYWLSPIAAFNGDIFLAKATPNGTLMVMLGDFTGHGLAAAIGAIPLASTFYGMVEKGFLLSDIVAEINQKLNAVLPVGVFCCACIAHIDFSRKILEIWNAGLPDCYLAHQNSDTLTPICSDSLPLGVVGSERLSIVAQRIAIQPNDKLYLLSDGILEVENKEGEQFGAARVRQLLNEKRDDGVGYGAMNYLKKTVMDFLADNERTDDISIVEIGIVEAEVFEACIDTIDDTLRIKSGSWRLSYEIRPETIKNFDPIPLILHAILEQSALQKNSGKLFSILSELYNNALDHGLLGLDSSLKRAPDGFENYYRQRLKRLAVLDTGEIHFDIRYTATATEGQLVIEVTDSGEGFDRDKMKAGDSADAMLYGRGILLLQSICDKVEFLDKGNRVRAEYRWS